MLRESLTISWRNIIQNKFRTFLTVLGIIIGVTAIIALITIVQGVIDETNRQFDTIGANTLIISAPGTLLKQGLTTNEIIKLSSVHGVSGFAPTISSTKSIQKDGIVYENITIDGKNEVYFRRNIDMLVQGRAINHLDVESKNNVCVINTEMAKKMFLGINPIGESIYIEGIKYEVIGMIDENKGMTSVMSVMSNAGDSILVPYPNVLTMNGTNQIYSLEIYLEDNADELNTVDTLKSNLNSIFNYKDNSYSLIEMDNLLDMMKNLQSMMQTMLAGIASISLIVGGIGIMNMMLVSVTERTTEIGLRKALGAEPFRIQIQFLSEAIMLSLIGGSIGVILGISISYIVALIIGYQFTISWFAVILGTSFSAAIGIIFGFAPAKKASELNPIDALRSI